MHQSINQFILSHTNSVCSNNKIANTFRLCVTGSTQGAYAPHKRATHAGNITSNLQSIAIRHSEVP